MDKQDTLRKIKEFENMTTKLAIDLIESEARKLMSYRVHLGEFVMAMGSCFFVNRWNDEIISNNYNELDGNKFGDIVEFFEMVYSLNERLNILEYPMRFTVNGEKRTDW